MEFTDERTAHVGRRAGTMKDLLTCEQVIALIQSFPGLNPAVGKAVIDEYLKKGVFVHAVLKSLDLEPVTMWRRKAL